MCKTILTVPSALADSYNIQDLDPPSIFQLNQTVNTDHTPIVHKLWGHDFTHRHILMKKQLKKKKNYNVSAPYAVIS